MEGCRGQGEEEGLRLGFWDPASSLLALDENVLEGVSGMF